MIQPNEIRINNLVIFDNCVCRISMINAADIVEVTSLDGQPKLFSTEITIEHILPIKITEDVLQKCGFVVKDSVFVYNGLGLKLMNINNHYFRANFPIKADIIHLHQLQNLYFALTNQELEIEL